MPDKLLILGDARCVWDDVAQWAKPGRRGTIDFPGHVMAVNMIGLYIENLDHWYSNDGRWLKRLCDARRPEWAKWYPRPQLHSVQTVDGVTHWPFSGAGSSGLNAARVGATLYEEVILAGIPLDDSGHNGEPPWKVTNFTNEVAPQVRCEENLIWKTARINDFGGRVRSMSGRTRDWLGPVHP